MIRKSTLVPTPFGLKKTENLKEGDVVYNKNGLPDRVTVCKPLFKGDGIMLILKLETGINLYVDRNQELFVIDVEKNKTANYKAEDIINNRISIGFPLIESPVESLEADPWKKIRRLGKMFERENDKKVVKRELQAEASSLGWKAIWNKKTGEYGLSHNYYFVDEIIEVKDRYEEYYDLQTESGSVLITPNYLILK